MPTIAGVTVTFWKAAARMADLLYVAATRDEYMNKSVAHSTFLSLDGPRWFSAGGAEWSTAAVCVVRSPTERFLAISEDGDVYTYVGGTETKERLDGKVVALRAVTAIDGLAHACGMKRQVFVRTGEATWEDLSAPRPAKGKTGGFEAIAGFSADDLYAVGWEGEIWRRKKGEWSQEKSPAKTILTGVACAEDGFVYACGQNGTLLRGRDGVWKKLKAPTSEDLWDIHAFGGKVYAASFTGLLVIEGTRVKAVDFGRSAPRTCHRLTSAEGVLWSVGAQDVFSFDGKAWQSVNDSSASLRGDKS